MGRPSFNYETKTVILTCMGKVQASYEELEYDFYSAPDVIFTYTNGNTCKDEWQRYFKFKIKGLKLIEVEQNYVDTLAATFSYEELVDEYYSYPDPRCVVGVPMGKFAGMTYEQYQEYRNQNQHNFAPFGSKLSKLQSSS